MISRQSSRSSGMSLTVGVASFNANGSAKDLDTSEVGEGLLGILRFLKEESVSTIRCVVVSVTYGVLSEAERHLTLVALDLDKDSAVQVEHLGNGGLEGQVIVILTEAECPVSVWFSKECSGDLLCNEDTSLGWVAGLSVPLLTGGVLDGLWVDERLRDLLLVRDLLSDGSISSSVVSSGHAIRVGRAGSRSISN